MPRGDRTGPLGQGPMSGRKAGFCSGSDSPGFASNGFGRGMGRGRRAFNSPQMPFKGQPVITEKQEKQLLEQELESLKEEMKQIEERLKEIKV